MPSKHLQLPTLSADNKDEKTNKKKQDAKNSKGRQKIAIEYRKDSNKRHVTFSKRRKGLFNYAKELCTLTRCSMAILVFSGAGKVFSFGEPNVDVVLQRYLQQNRGAINGQEDSYQDVTHHNIDIDDNKKDDPRAQGDRANDDNGEQFWWNKPVDDLELPELEQYMTQLEQMRDNMAMRGDQLANLVNSYHHDPSSISNCSSSVPALRIDQPGESCSNNIVDHLGQPSSMPMNHDP